MPAKNGTGPKGQGSRGGQGRGQGGSGQGRGQGGGGRGRGGGFGGGPGGNCVCPSCGEKIPHRMGVACFDMKCPKCGTAMTRE